MNRRGSVLILSYIVVVVLTLFGFVFVTRSVSESNINRRYADSVRAFWIAEAGLAQGYYNLINSQALPAGQINFGNGTYEIIDTDLGYGIELKIIGIQGTGQRIVKGYLLRVPHPFENTISAGGDLSLNGLLARVEVYDQTRISGAYSETWGASGWFEDKQEGVDPAFTTIEVPDKNDNSIDDEFADFVLFGQEAVNSYPAEETVYIQTDDTVNIFPDSALIGKKVVFVEGSAPGTGNVNIYFDSTWEEGEDLSIISTGTVTYIQPLQFQEDARLSAASWGDYNEASIFRSEHESVIYTHDDANFVDILDWGSTSGNIIANDDISLLEILTYEKFYFSDRAMNGDMPPGFVHLAGSTGNLSTHLANWQEE